MRSTQTYNILQHVWYTTNIPTDPHTVSTTDIKNNMQRHIHTSTFYTPPPHISCSVAPSLVAPLPNSEQINHPFSYHMYTMLTPNHIHHHYAPFITHTQHTLPLQLNPHTHHVATPGFVDRPLWSDRTAGRRCWLVDHKREDQPSSSD